MPLNPSRLSVDPNVTPDAPAAEQPVLGIIGMGAMGKMYAKYLSKAGWKRYESIEALFACLGLWVT